MDWFYLKEVESVLEDQHVLKKSFQILKTLFGWSLKTLKCLKQNWPSKAKKAISG